MTEQQYTPDEARAVAAGLRLVTAGRFATADEAADCIDELADRIERPVPTTDEWHREQDARLHRMRALSPDKTTPHPPTREQIAEALEPDPANRDWQTHLYASRVFALIQNGADR